MGALVNDEFLSVLFQFIFNFFNDTNQETLATLVGLSILSTEYLKDFSPEKSPLGGVIWESEEVKHLLEELVSNLISSRLIDIVLNDDLILDESKTFILENF